MDLEVIAEAVPFRHRQWNHFCFAYSSNKKVGKLYYNGELIKQVSEGNFTDIESGESVLQSSFIIAQEPDIFEGGYDPAQLFNGEISELNMWNKVIDDTEIKSLATCSKLVRGDVIAWEKEYFTIFKAEASVAKNISLFCEQGRDLVIFPQKNSFKGAKALCHIHGGQLVVPFSKRQEKEIMNVVESFSRKTFCKNKGIFMWKVFR